MRRRRDSHTGQTPRRPARQRARDSASRVEPQRDEEGDGRVRTDGDIRNRPPAPDPAVEGGPRRGQKPMEGQGVRTPAMEPNATDSPVDESPGVDATGHEATGPQGPDLAPDRGRASDRSPDTGPDDPILEGRPERSGPEGPQGPYGGKSETTPSQSSRKGRITRKGWNRDRCPPPPTGVTQDERRGKPRCSWNQPPGGLRSRAEAGPHLLARTGRNDREKLGPQPGTHAKSAPARCMAREGHRRVERGRNHDQPCFDRADRGAPSRWSARTTRERERTRASGSAPGGDSRQRPRAAEARPDRSRPARRTGRPGLRSDRRKRCSTRDRNMFRTRKAGTGTCSRPDSIGPCVRSDRPRDPDGGDGRAQDGRRAATAVMRNGYRRGESFEGKYASRG